MSNRRLSVVQLVPALESGGVERGTLEVAAELVRKGHRSVVISAGGRLVEQLVRQGSEHLTWPIGNKSPLTLRCVPRLRKWLSRNSIDILHARSRVPAWVGWLAWKSLPVVARPRFVTTMHGLNSVNWFSRIMTRGELVIAVSESVRDYIQTHYPEVPSSRIRIIPRGVDPREFPYGFTPADVWRHRWESDHPQLTGKQILTLAGRITRLKGHHTFLKLISELKVDGRSVHGLIVGDEDPHRRQYAQEVRQRVKDLNLTQNVTFLGHRSDIREIYAVSSIVLSLSSKPESFGRTALEPLVMGVPVVGYEHGGVGEILRKVFPTGAVKLQDASQLKQRIAAVLDEAPRVPPSNAFQLQSTLDSVIGAYSELSGSLSPLRPRQAA